MRKPRIKLAGRRFGRLLVIRFDSFASDGRSLWRCKCDCGKVVVMRSNNLQHGNHSCGCYNPGSAKHGMRNTPEYQSWRAMRKRCYYKKAIGFERYGGNGVQVCNGWRTSFETFYKDMGPRPKGTSLDRFPNPKGNYEPSNCRWATRQEQARNSSLVLRISYKGKVYCGADLANLLGIKRPNFYWRLRHGKILGATVLPKE